MQGQENRWQKLVIKNNVIQHHQLSLYSRSHTPLIRLGRLLFSTHRKGWHYFVFCLASCLPWLSSIPDRLLWLRTSHELLRLIRYYIPDPSNNVIIGQLNEQVGNTNAPWMCLFFGVVLLCWQLYAHPLQLAPVSAELWIPVSYAPMFAIWTQLNVAYIMWRNHSLLAYHTRGMGRFFHIVLYLGPRIKDIWKSLTTKCTISDNKNG